MNNKRQATMTVVLVDPRRPSLIPVEAIDLLAGDIQYTEEMPVRVPWSLPRPGRLTTARTHPCCCRRTPIIRRSRRDWPPATS